jgi:hypothetical protein
MIEVQRMAAQGDVLFRRVEALPVGAVRREQPGPIVVAHSETGHHHAIQDAGVHLYRERGGDPLIRFLFVEGAHADIVHLRAQDTHETLRLTPGFWEVRRQREWTPEGERAVLD